MASVNQSFSSPSRLPPGFRFVPKDEELIMILFTFLFDPEQVGIDIPEFDDFYQHPKNLAYKFEHGIGSECYFFCNIDFKNSAGSRRNLEVGDVGYWKTTSKDQEILFGKDGIGVKKTFAFHEGKQRKSKPTGWILHEYRLAKASRIADRGASNNRSRMVLCRLRWNAPPTAGDMVAPHGS